ncbi:hypothetical protein [Macrococcus animalis]|uniref:hypothetical protein n=1 Tax=Macrococcus animalis TaxID=3395467 RepID=UPI0039BE1EFB
MSQILESQTKQELTELKGIVVIARHNIRQSKGDVDRKQFLNFSDELIKKINEIMEDAE